MKQPLGNAQALVAIAITFCGCGRPAEQATPPGSSERPPKVAPEPLPVAQAKSAAEREQDELHDLVSKVTPEERSRAAAGEAELAAAWKKAAPKPKVLFEVPAVRCGYQDVKRKQRSKFTGLCYSDPKVELWGLGPFAVDDDGALWIDDTVTGRAVGFDRSGKLVGNVVYESEPENPSSLVVTAADIWIDSLRPGDKYMPGWLQRTSRDGKTSRAYSAKNVVGAEYQDRGWVVPDNPSRVLRWYADGPTDVVDVSFLDDTRMQLSAPHPLRARGHRYWVDCEPDRDAKNPRPATLVIDDHAVPAPGCLQIHYVGPEGDIVASTERYYHFDVHGKLLDIAVRASSDSPLLTYTAVGPDGNVYQYLPQKRSVQFVELPWFSG